MVGNITAVSKIVFSKSVLSLRTIKYPITLIPSVSSRLGKSIPEYLKPRILVVTVLSRES